MLHVSDSAFSEKTAILIATALVIFLFAFASPAVAQAGHPINSIDTSPGTSVPHAMTDPVIDPEKSNDGIIRLPKSGGTSTSEMDKDVDTMKTESNTTHPASGQERKSEKSIYPNKADPVNVDTE
jgi:hypothetical protein